MSEIEPITREEKLLGAVAGEGNSGVTPKTRQEHYLSAIAGETDLPAKMQEEGPLTREEIYYQKILDNGGAGGGGGEAEGTVEINITQNGTITRNVARYASAEITTNVPNPSTGTKQISQNGTHDVTDYASAQVNVPNSYSASDEGKVVDNGALVAQTSQSITANGTYDTTLNDEVVVSVSGGGSDPVWSTNVTNVYAFSLRNSTIKDDIVIDFGTANVTTTDLFRSAKGSKSNTSVTIKCNSVGTLTNMEQSATKITTLILDTEVNPIFGNQALYSGSIQRVLGTPINETTLGGTGQYRHFNSTNIIEFYLVPNVLATGGTITTGELVDDCIISVANALKEGLASSQTLTISDATTKAKCSTIVGTVTEVTDGGDTYHMFTASNSGSTTLIDFVTNTKGWTIS